jgi:tripartite-type tricarboxylate transporter receptor subunit TctC
MSQRICFLMIRLIIILLLGFDSARSASDEFFSGKTIRIVVGFTAGGSFDAYSRTLARHMGSHIPGNPAFIVENMPGAGSLIVANHLYKVAKPDGLTIGNFIGGLVMGQVLGRPGIEFDGLKYEYIGVPIKDYPVCAFSKASGITSMEKWMTAKTPAKVGATGPGATTHDVPTVLKAALGLPVQIISGYKGPTEILLSVEGGELDGVCNSWGSLKVTSIRAIEAGDLTVAVQAVPRPHPELARVPLAISFAKTDEARQLVEAGVHNVTAIIYPYVLPPGTPKDRVQILRKAFIETLKDPQFAADAKKSKLDIDPLPGEEVEKTVAGLLKTSPATLAKLKEVLK